MKPLPPGEWVLRVPQLALPSSVGIWAAFEQAMGSPAVQLLFHECVPASKGLCCVSGLWHRCVISCRRLDGIPLALELGRRPRWTPLGVRGVQARASVQGLQVFTRGRRTAVERHQSLSGSPGFDLPSA